MYLPYHAGALAMPTHDCYVSLAFDVVIPSLLSLPNHMN